MSETIKELLASYGEWDEKVRKKKAQMAALRDRMTSQRVTYTDEPRGGEPYSMEDFAADIAGMQDELDALKEERFIIYSEIMSLAFRLQSVKQFDIIYRRDIHRDSWRKICRDLDVTRSTATDLHSRAVKALSEIKNGSEC